MWKSLLNSWWRGRSKASRLLVRRPSVRPQLEILEDHLVPAAVFTVDRPGDMGQGAQNSGDLRFCVTNAVAGDTINFNIGMGTDLDAGLVPAL